MHAQLDPMDSNKSSPKLGSRFNSPQVLSSEENYDPYSDYNVDNYYAVMKLLWDFNPNNDIKQRKLHHDLRTLVDFSLTHSLLLGNNQKREIKISDLSIFPLSSRSPSKAVALVFRNSLPDSQYLFYGCLRAKNVDVCPHAAIATYLFSRLHIPDSQGSIEILLDNQKARNTFHESNLLCGDKKLLPLSSNQQYKAAIKALQLAGIHRFDNIDIATLLTSQDNDLGIDANDKPASNNINNLPEHVLYKLAGFYSREHYKIERDVLEPPQELLNQIFPFINEETFDIYDIFTIRIKNVLSMLRRSLVQDMVILKREYPNNPICQHPIFNSNLFNKFAQDLESTGGTSEQISPSPSPKQEHNTLLFNQNLQVVYENQVKHEAQINHLQKSIDFFVRQQTGIYKDLQSFIQRQNEVYSRQAEFIKTNPHLYSNVANSTMKDSMTTTLDLLARVNSSQQNFFAITHNANVYNTDFPILQPHPQVNPHHMMPPKPPMMNPQGYPVPPPPPPPFPDKVPPPQGHLSNPPTIPQRPPHPQPHPQPHLSHGPHHQHHHPAQPPSQSPHSHIPHIPQPMMAPMMPTMHLPENEYSMKRRKAISRRLSRHAIDVFEMWEDFKSLEKELEENEISITEWLKLHGSSERQFRHTRQKIIRFIEDEAQRRNASVDMVKDLLHNKMKNRVKPWTLDEVQRMLTSGKRIVLDEY